MECNQGRDIARVMLKCVDIAVCTENLSPDVMVMKSAKDRV